MRTCSRSLLCLCVRVRFDSNQRKQIQKTLKSSSSPPPPQSSQAENREPRTRPTGRCGARVEVEPRSRWAPPSPVTAAVTVTLASLARTPPRRPEPVRLCPACCHRHRRRVHTPSQNRHWTRHFCTLHSALCTPSLDLDWSTGWCHHTPGCAAHPRVSTYVECNRTSQRLLAEI